MFAGFIYYLLTKISIVEPKQYQAFLLHFSWEHCIYSRF